MTVKNTFAWVQYTVLEIQPKSVNYTLVARICNNFEKNKRVDSVDRVVLFMAKVVSNRF